MVLQPHQVAGSKVATPIFEPAEQERGADVADGWTQPGGFWSTALFGQITFELDTELLAEEAFVVLEKVEGTLVVEVEFCDKGGMVEEAWELEAGTEAPGSGGNESPETMTEVGWSGWGGPVKESGGRVISGGKPQLPVDEEVVEFDDEVDTEELDEDWLDCDWECELDFFSSSSSVSVSSAFCTLLMFFKSVLTSSSTPFSMSSIALFRFSTSQATALKMSVMRLVLSWHGSGEGGVPISAASACENNVSGTVLH